MKGDKIFYYSLILLSIFLIIITISIGILQLINSWNIFEKFGINFFISTDWDPVKERFGILPAIIGSFLTSIIALFLAIPICILSAFFFAEILPIKFKMFFSSFVELLAAIPSVIYGLWALYILVPVLRVNIYPALQNYFGFLPLFQDRITGLGILTAGIILAIMISPIIILIIKEAIEILPVHIKEAIISLGTTKYEYAKLIFSHIKLAIFGAIILGFARAYGETMAVAMIIGGRFEIPKSLFDVGYTMPSLIANEFTEAVTDLHFQALFGVGFVIFLIALLNIIVARLLIRKTTKYLRGISL